MDLPQVRGELGLLVPATGHVLVRHHHLTPGLPRHPALDGLSHRLALLAPCLLVEALAQQFHLHPADLKGLGGRDGGQQALGGVQGAVGVVAGDGLLVRPRVAPTPDLRHQTALRVAQRPAEHLVPGLPHQLELRRRVPLTDASVGEVRIVDEALDLLHGDGVRRDGAMNLALDEWAEPGL